MYDWRTLSDPERAKLLKSRKAELHPWHAPPRFDYKGKTKFIVTASCYEHQHIIGISPERMAECEDALLEVCNQHCTDVFAWCVLPNHYHVSIETNDVRNFQSELGKFHGRTSFRWNGEDEMRGRKVWYRSFERPMESERHFYVSLNYIHNNPVKHGYVDRWQEWPFSSAREFLKKVGRDEAMRFWREYPVLDYGKEWDAN
jgi:putative transposase